MSSSDYAKYYFVLRTYVEAKKKSFPLRPLDLNTIMKLQKNTLSAEYGLKVKYATGLNKSFWRKNYLYHLVTSSCILIFNSSTNLNVAFGYLLSTIASILTAF